MMMREEEEEKEEQKGWVVMLENNCSTTDRDKLQAEDHKWPINLFNLAFQS